MLWVIVKYSRIVYLIKIPGCFLHFAVNTNGVIINTCGWVPGNVTLYSENVSNMCDNHQA